MDSDIIKSQQEEITPTSTSMNGINSFDRKMDINSDVKQITSNHYVQDEPNKTVTIIDEEQITKTYSKYLISLNNI